jgi:hypothetical protein
LIDWSVMADGPRTAALPGGTCCVSHYEYVTFDKP